MNSRSPSPSPSTATEFKSLKSDKMARMRDALRDSEKKQKTDLVVIDTRKSGTSEDDAREAIRQFNKPGRVMQRVIVFGRDYMLDEEIG
jgi:hypothetical protein